MKNSFPIFIRNSFAFLFIILLAGGFATAQINSNTTPATQPQTTETVQPSPTPSTDSSQNSGSSSLQNSINKAGNSSEELKIAPPSRYVIRNAPVKIPRFDAAPVIDGQLNDAVWQNAALFGEFLQTNPGDNIKPTHPTEFMMGYDAKNLYMAFRVKQDSDKVRATVARRDNIFNDDYVLVHLDTFNDQRQAYLLFFNPLGIQADGTFTEGRGEDYSLDIIMESKGVLTEDGFTIEVAIPFKSLRYEAGKNKQWGLHVNRRVKYNNNEYNSWMPTNRSISGWLNQAGHITGLEGIETTRQLEINPSLTLSQNSRRSRHTFDGNPNGRYVNEGLSTELGMTAKFSLTPTITLDFAYNPDFAQVEADAAVSTANVRFPIFFAEKRPFFLERNDIFQSGLNVVNTRVIVDPDIAMKLTGRRGRNTFGIMYASDNAPGNYSEDEREDLLNCLRLGQSNPCPNERFIGKNADIGVLRVKRDIGRQHNIGFFATTYNFVDQHNNTAGIDGRFKLTPKITTDFQLLGTTSRRCFFDPDFEPNLNQPQGDLNRAKCGGSLNEYRTGNGVGYRVWAERAGRNLYMNYLAMGRSRDYRADVGFTQQTDTNYVGSFVRYETDRDAKKAIIFKRVFNESNLSYDWRGRSQVYRSNTQGMLAFQRQIYLGGGFELGYERVFEHEFGPRRKPGRQGAFFGDDSERSAHRREIYAFVEASPVKQLFFSLVPSYQWGVLDYDLGAGRKFPRVSPVALLLGQGAPLDPGAGNLLYLDASGRYQPTSEWQIQLNYSRRRLTRNDNGRVAFDENVYSLRSTYQFNREFFARLRLDYSNVSSRLRPQLIFGWTPSPGTALYAGYTDDINYNGFNPFTRVQERGFHSNGRTFFIKASYLFRKNF